MFWNIFVKKYNFSEWEGSKKNRGLVSDGKIGKIKITLLEPETFMNKSGLSVRSLVTSKKGGGKVNSNLR